MCNFLHARGALPFLTACPRDLSPLRPRPLGTRKPAPLLAVPVVPTVPAKKQWGRIEMGKPNT